MMPGLDGTGPMGMGPMTGGGRGWCNPYGPMARMWGTGYAPRWGMPWGYGYAAMPGAYPRFGLGLGPCGGGMAWGRGRGMGRGGMGMGFGRGMGRGWGW